MNLNKSPENTIKHGRVWLYLSESFPKDIGLEWSLRFDPFNCSVSFDGGERRYICSFWFIWVFYISFNDIFKWYPKEWNSCTNNNKGGYIDSAERKIGISQYGWNAICTYFWDDGEDSWYPDKENKIFHKYIWLDQIFIGSYKYVTIDSFEDKPLYVDLTEGRKQVKATYRHWYKTYKRFYMKPFQHKGKNIRFEDSEEVKIPTYNPEKYPGNPDRIKEIGMKGFWINMKEKDTIEIIKNKYVEKVLDKREEKVSRDWVPEEYRKQFERKKKLERILDE